MSRRHVIARARHRHGSGRPRHPGRVAEVRCARPAACRSRRARAERRIEGTHLPEIPRGSARVGGGGEAHARRRNRRDRHSAQPTRRPRAADRRDHRGRGDLGRRPARAGAWRVPIRGSLTDAARERARHARGPLSVRRVRRAPTAHRLGSHRRRDPRPQRFPPAGGHQCGDDSGSRSFRRVSRRRRRPCRGARRGDGLRGAGRPDVPARRVDVAHRGDHARPRPRLACARRARGGPVLEGRGHRASVRARRGDRQGIARASGSEPQGRHAATDGRASPGRTGREQPADVPERASRRDRHRAVGPDRRGRAFPRRDRRLAALHPDAVRRARARTVGPCARGTVPRVARAGGPVDLVGRRHCASPPGRRYAAADGRDHDLAGGDRRARRAGSGAERALRRALPRERRARAADTAPPPRPAHAAVAAAPQGAGPVAGCAPLRLVPDHPRDLPRMPAGRLRSAGA